MRVLIINADYPGFLAEHYFRHPGLTTASYAAQLTARNDSLFGVADFYSRNFVASGHEAMEVHVNNPWLQYAWALENHLRISAPPSPRIFAARQARAHFHRLYSRSTALTSSSKIETDSIAPKISKWRTTALRSLIKPLVKPLIRSVQWLNRQYRRKWELKILYAQIVDFRPDVILNQEMAYLRGAVLDSLKPAQTLLLGQIASSLPENDDFRSYDLVVSSLPNQVAWFRARGVNAEVNRLAFEPSVLNRLGAQPQRDIAVSFVGSLSPEHTGRIAFLEHVARRTPLKVWGSGIERLPKSSPLHACYQGEAWGREMYNILRRSKITLNYHIDLAECWANNMRLYEATGMGALLITDQKKNLAEIFRPGEHVAAYMDAEDCVRQITALLADDATRERIAAAGQKHAIETQNYALRVMEIATLTGTLRTLD